jgi:hypothetical protein
VQPDAGAVKAGEVTGLPVMVDFGRITATRNLNGLLLENGRLNPDMEAGRKRGIIFELGHGVGMPLASTRIRSPGQQNRSFGLVAGERYGCKALTLPFRLELVPAPSQSLKPSPLIEEPLVVL